MGGARAPGPIGRAPTVALQGQITEAETFVEEALRSSERTAMSFARNDWVVRLAEVRLWRGAVREASEGAMQARGPRTTIGWDRG